MEMTVTPAPLVIGATGIDAIMQNIRIIVLTVAYSVPLDRGFAHVGGFIDTPLPHITARYIAEMTDAIEAKEPRVKVDSIDLTRTDEDEAQQGILRPRIRFHVKEGVEL